MGAVKNIFCMPINGARCDIKTSDGLVIATAYDRIVVGDRGPYVEISESSFVTDSVVVQEGQEWRTQRNAPAYYVWLRTTCAAKAKVYYQLKHVSYADYKTGFYYVDPWLVTANGDPFIERSTSKRQTELFF